MHTHNICFTGSGHHYPWQIGVALYLQQTYDLTDCSFTGASGGTFVAFLLATDVPITEYLSKWVKDLYRVIGITLTGSYCFYHNAVRMITSRYMKEDSYKKANHRLFISITRVSLRGWKNEIVDVYNSDDDLYDAIGASAHIPIMTSLSLFYKFRNTACIDGGFSYNWIKLKENTLLIPPYKWNLWKRYTYALTTMITNSEKQFYALVKQGYEDAKKNDIEFIKLGLTKKPSE